MSRQYYKNKTTGEICVINSYLSNGHVLAKITDEGIASGNQEDNKYVSFPEFKKEWEETTFTPFIADADKYYDLVTELFINMASTLRSHGIGEDLLQDFENVEHNLRLLPTIIFQDSVRNTSDLERLIRTEVKGFYTEDVADEILSMETDTMYYVAFAMRNVLRNSLKKL